MTHPVNRRTFVKSGAIVAAGVATSLASPSARGANERVRVAFIGVANRGGQLIQAAKTHENLEIVALCDVDQVILAKRKAELDGKPDTYGDFREVLARDDVDAVIVATPDHWHALITIQACEAGKDVYIEKPLSATIVEGRAMINAARRHKRVVQVGLHRRSSEMYEELHQRVKGDHIGKVTVGHCYRLTNMWPDGIGRKDPEPAPDTLNWDMWLGPRPAREYQENIAPYKFRWWKQYSSQLGNWGVHYFDLFRWMVDEESPASVVALGGQYAVDDDRTIPDTMQALFEFASGRMFVFGQYEASGYPMQPAEIDLRGTKGIVYASGGGYEVIAEKPGQFQTGGPRCEPLEVQAKFDNNELTARHIGDFLACIKSRETPKCDVEVGHLSTVYSHLANISLATRSRLDWDAKAERITNNDAANELLHYAYREPWKLG